MEVLGLFIRAIIAIIMAIFIVGFIVSVGALMVIFILCIPVAFVFFLFA